MLVAPEEFSQAVVGDRFGAANQMIESFARQPHSPIAAKSSSKQKQVGMSFSLAHHFRPSLDITVGHATMGVMFGRWSLRSANALRGPKNSAPAGFLDAAHSHRFKVRRVYTYSHTC